MKKILCQTVSIFLLIFVSTRCKNQVKLEDSNNETNIIENIEKIQIPNNIHDLSEYVVDYDFIQLETNSKCMIGEISKLLKYKNKYFIFDKITKSVFCFDLNGNFLYKISKQGKGPGEYYALKDININEEKPCLELFDRSKKAILSFNLEGDFISQTKIDMYFDSFVDIGKQRYLFQRASDKEEHFNFYLLKNGKVVNKKVKCKGFDNTHILNQITKTKENIFITHGCSNVVYGLVDGSIFPKYYIDFGEDNLPNDILTKQEIGIEEYLKLILKDYAMFIISFYEDEKYLTFSYAKKKKLYWVIKDKVKNIIQKGNIQLFGIDIMPPIYKYDNSFYSIIDPSAIKHKTSERQYSGLENTFLQKKMKTGSNDLNPIILKFNLTKN